MDTPGHILLTTYGTGAIGKRFPERQQKTKALGQQDTGLLLEHFRLMTHPPRVSRPWRLLQEKLDGAPSPPTIAIGQRLDGPELKGSRK